MDYTNEEDELVIVRESLAMYGKNKFTEDEYIELVKTSTELYEFYKRAIFQMARDGRKHALIQSTVMIGIDTHLKNKSCAVFGQALTVHIEKNSLYT